MFVHNDMHITAGEACDITLNKAGCAHDVHNLRI